MFKEVLNVEMLKIWPLLALVIFFTIMTLVFIWVMRPHSKESYKNISDSIFDAQERGVSHD